MKLVGCAHSPLTWHEKSMNFHENKGPFTNTCKGGPDAKKISVKNFQGPPLWASKFFGAPFLTRKIGVNPIENHIDSLFRGKISVFFFRAPLFGLKNFQGTLFASGPPLTSVCERSLRESVVSLQLHYPSKESVSSDVFCVWDTGTRTIHFGDAVTSHDHIRFGHDSSDSEPLKLLPSI